MKILKLCLAITTLLISTLTSFAQAKNSQRLFYLEVDPFAYINKGYSIHPGYEN